jgi:hypothetical protein
MPLIYNLIFSRRLAMQIGTPWINQFLPNMQRHLFQINLVRHRWILTKDMTK